jgi:hypothetical protein
MDGKTVAIAVLVLVAMLMGGIVFTELRPDSKAYAQGGVYATYMVSSVQVANNESNFVVLDTASRRLIFYEIGIQDFKLKIAGGRELVKDFGRKGI